MTVSVDPGMRFWLRYVVARGGLAEADGEAHLAVLPEVVRQESGFDELVHVTGDPDIARDGTAVLLGPGHPALTAAADHVLAVGDVGLLALDDTRPRPPDAETLLERARDQFPVDHGRIFATGSPVPAFRVVLRIGALVAYTLSADEHYQEQVEYWIDVESRIPLSSAGAQRLAAAQPLPPARSDPALVPGYVQAVLATAREVIDEAALRRRAELSVTARRACAEEMGRAEDYYGAQLATLRQRAESVAEGKKATYDARIEATAAERERRLAEIGEKYAPAHDVRPFRAHLVRVPAVRLPAEVRRGERRHELHLDYLTAAGEYAGLRCPACSSTAPLILAKTGFGCAHCLKRPAAPEPAAASADTKAVPTQRAATEPATHPAQAAPTAERPAKTPGASTAARATTASPTPHVKTSARAERAPRAGTSASPKAPRRDGHEARRASGSVDPRQVTFELWQAVANGDRRAAENLCDPHSPAATAIRLYGPSGLLVCLELAPGDRPTGASGEPYGEWRGRRALTGTLETEASRQEFMLTWADEEPLRVAELMPFAAIYRIGLLGLTGRRPRSQRALPKPRIPLDPTAEQLWAVMLPSHDLQLTLRALCALWRLADLEAYLARHDPPVLAAALDRLIRYWSQTAGATYAEAAARYGVAESDIRAAGAALHKELKLTRERPW